MGVILLKILIVDDDHAQHVWIKNEFQGMKSEGVEFEFSDAYNGAEAIEVLNSQADFNLITLDINMPESDGKDFLTKIQKNEAWKRLNVIILSTEEGKDAFPELEKLGAKRFYRKPLNRSNVHDILKNFLGSKVEYPVSEKLPMEFGLMIKSFFQTIEMQKKDGKFKEKLIKQFEDSIKKIRDGLNISEQIKLAMETIEVADREETVVKNEFKSIIGEYMDSETEAGQKTESLILKQLSLVEDKLNEIDVQLIQPKKDTINIMADWNNIFQWTHNVKGFGEPSFLGGLFTLVNTELTNLARDCSNSVNSSSLDTKAMETLFSLVTLLKRLLQLQPDLDNLLQIKKKIEEITSDERKKIEQAYEELEKKLNGFDEEFIKNLKTKDITEYEAFKQEIISALRSGRFVFHLSLKFNDQSKRSDFLNIKKIFESIRELKRIQRYQPPVKEFTIKYLLLFPKKEGLEKRVRELVESIEIKDKMKECRVNILFSDQISEQKPKDEEPSQKKSRGSSQGSIPVPLDDLEKIYTNVEKLSEAKSELQQQLDNSGKEHEIGSGVIKKLGVIAREIHKTVLDVRQVDIFDIFKLIERRISQNNSNLRHDDFEKIKFIPPKNEHEDIRIDKKVMDELKGCINILTDNAFAHAFAEIPKECEISVWAEEDSNSNTLRFHFKNNRKGLDREAIKARAIERKILAPGQEYSDQEIFSCIFNRGFSTAKVSNQLAGKGIGMYTIKEVVTRNFGIIRVKSKEQEGTEFIMEFPRKLSINDGLIFKLAGKKYGIPIEFVRTIRLMKDEQSQLKSWGGSIFSWEVATKQLGLKMNKEQKNLTLLPIVDLREWLQVGDSTQYDKSQLAIIDYRNNLFGIFIDEILQQEEIVVKRMSENMLSIQCRIDSHTVFQTYTISGDGQMIPLFSMDALSSFLNQQIHKLAVSSDNTNSSSDSTQKIVSLIEDRFHFIINKESFVIKMSDIKRVYYKQDVTIYPDQELSRNFSFTAGTGSVANQKQQFIVIDGAVYTNPLKVIDTERSFAVLEVKIDATGSIGVMVDEAVGMIDGEELTQLTPDTTEIAYYDWKDTNKDEMIRLKDLELEQLRELPKIFASDEKNITTEENNLDQSIKKDTNLVIFNVCEWQLAVSTNNLVEIKSLNGIEQFLLPGFKPFVKHIYYRDGKLVPFIDLSAILDKSKSETYAMVWNRNLHCLVLSLELNADEAGSQREWIGILVDKEPIICMNDDFHYNSADDFPCPFDRIWVDMCGEITKEILISEEIPKSDRIFYQLKLDKLFKEIIKP